MSEQKPMRKRANRIPEPTIGGRAKVGSLSIPLKDLDILGLAANDNGQQTAYVALKYYDPTAQCFSCWAKGELEAFSNFVRKVSQMTWEQIRRSGGSAGHKTGLGFAFHKDNAVLPSKAKTLQTVSEDTNYFELRISQKARVHGFRANSTFFLVLLDKDHELFPD